MQITCISSLGTDESKSRRVRRMGLLRLVLPAAIMAQLPPLQPALIQMERRPLMTRTTVLPRKPWTLSHRSRGLCKELIEPRRRMTVQLAMFHSMHRPWPRLDGLKSPVGSPCCSYLQWASSCQVRLLMLCFCLPATMIN